MTRPVYLTARCPRGCERWGTPHEISEHVGKYRCSGVAWFRRPAAFVLIRSHGARVLASTAAAHLVSAPGGLADDDGGVGPTLTSGPHRAAADVRLRSPIDGVAPRLWWLTVRYHLDNGSALDDVVAAALDPVSFPGLVPDGLAARLSNCEHCGELVAGVGVHQRTSSRCRAASAANRVNDLWALGYRDPWSAAERPPLSWTELRTARWRHRIALVELPRSNAVLLVPR